MISFSYFCDIEAFLESYEKSIYNDDLKSKSENNHNAQLSNVLQAAGLLEAGTTDDAVFHALISSCDMQSVRQLIDYFDPSAPIQEFLQKRLQELRGNQEQPVEVSSNKKKGDSLFYTYLREYVTKKKGYASIADFYNHAGISRQRISKLRNDDSAISREFALHLAVGLELNYEEAVEFLQNAGYSFKPANRREAIISYIMRNQKYTFDQMEEILYLFSEKTFLEE